MLEKNKQTISGINNSTVQQAQGTINNIMLVGETTIKDLIYEVVRSELNIVAEKAHEKFSKMLDEFKNRLVEELAKLEKAQEAINKFKEPRYQFILHDTIKEYAQSGREDTKSDLIDFLIDRLQVDENSTEQFVIEDAIHILPKLSYVLTRFLGAVLMRRMEERNIAFIFRRNLEEQARLYEHLDEISNLDIAYLHQLGCCETMPGLRHMVTIEEEMRQRYDLFFRRPTTMEAYNTFVSHNPILAPGINGISFLCIDPTYDNECRLTNLSTSSLKDDLRRADKMNMWPALQRFIETLPPYSNDEIKDFLISINPNWGKLIHLFHQEDIQRLRLTPVGVYIANRIVQKEKMRVARATLRELF